MRNFGGIALALGIVVGAGCGTSGPTSQEACGDLAKARCARLAACSNGTAITRLYGDMTTCQTREQLECTLGEGEPQTGGSPTTAEQCAAALPTLDCADLFSGNSPPECVNKGARSNGMPCAFQGQCGSTYCINNKTSLCGVCGDAPPSGISCVGSNCARGDFCTARTQTCQKPAQIGDTCDNITQLCTADLACFIAAGATTSTCTQAVATLGAACGGTTMTACDGTFGLTCVGKACVAINYAADGMPCGNFTGGGFGACNAGGGCYTSTGIAQIGEMGTCKAAALEGKACDTTLGPTCLTPARCVVSGSGTAGTCALPTDSGC